MDHTEIIKKLGGDRVVAAAFGVSRQVVTSWKRNGIAWKYRPAIKKMAAFKIPDDFLTPPDMRKGA